MNVLLMAGMDLLFIVARIETAVKICLTTAEN